MMTNSMEVPQRFKKLLHNYKPAFLCLLFVAVFKCIPAYCTLTVYLNYQRLAYARDFARADLLVKTA